MRVHMCTCVCARVWAHMGVSVGRGHASRDREQPSVVDLSLLPCLTLWNWVSSLQHKPHIWPAAFWNFQLSQAFWHWKSGIRTPDISHGLWDLNIGHPACIANMFDAVCMQWAISLALKSILRSASVTANAYILSIFIPVLLILP